MKQRKMKKGASALTLEFAPDSNKFLCPDVEVDPAEVVQVGASNWRAGKLITPDADMKHNRV